MNDYLFLMHNDALADAAEHDWPSYLAKLQKSGNFSGGSAIGDGVCVRKNGAAAQLTEHLSGYIRVQAESVEAATKLVSGNPVFEAGGTVEIRELPRTS